MIAFCGPGVTTTLVGGLGTVAGVTGADGADRDDDPVELLAVAVNVYGVPLVRPAMTHDVAGDVTVQVPAAVEPL